MKKLSILLVSLMLIVSSCTFFSNDYIAKVNGKKISLDELYRYMPQANFEILSSEEKEAKITSICEDYLMREYLEDQGDLDSGDVFWEISVWEIRELANGAYQTLIIDPILNDVALRHLYEKMKYDLNISHVLIGFNTGKNLNDRSKVEALELATEISKEITNANFQELALKYSDDSSVKRNNGVLGFAKAGRWVKPFEEAAYQLEPGEISEPVETEFGFHIIKLNERKENSLEPYEIAKSDIEEMALESWRLQFMAREQAVVDSLSIVNNIVLDDSLVTDFLDRYNRLSENVFYSEQFTPYDIMEIFDDSFSVGTIGERKIDKNWIVQYLKMISLKVPPRFTDRSSFDSFVESSRMGASFYKSAMDLGLNKSKEFIKTKNVYLAKKSVGLFNKLYVYELITPETSELRNFYENIKDELYLLEARVQVKEVLVEDSLQAVDLLKQVRDGEDISLLAEKYSKRNTAKKNKGLIPAFKKTQYGEMSIAAFNMLDGEVGGPYKVGEYYSVIKRIKFIPESYRSFDTIRYRILSDFRNQHMDTHRSKQIDMLNNIYRYKINDKIINNEK